MRSNLRQGTVLMWLLIAVLITAAVAGAVLFLIKVKGVNPITTFKTGTGQSTPSVQSVSSSDEVGAIQNELRSTNFDSIDSDLQQTSKDLNSF